MRILVPWLLAILVARSDVQEGSRDRPQRPVRPFPYQEREITIPVDDGALTLAGTWTCPDGAGAFPAVVLVPGGTPFDRDGSFAGHEPYRVLSDALTRAGCATLRMDDRGVGESGGAKLDCTLGRLAADVEACVRFAMSQSNVDSEHVGIVGHSGGALLVSLAAGREPAVAFVVLLGCPARPLPDLIAAQMAAEGDGTLEIDRCLGREAARIFAETLHRRTCRSSSSSDGPSSSTACRPSSASPRGSTSPR